MKYLTAKEFRRNDPSWKRWRYYESHADRKRAISQLIRRGYNYFVCFADVQSPYALEYSVSEWVTEKGGVYVNW